MTKTEQLNTNRIKLKKEPTFGKSNKGKFGKRPSRGDFGQKPSSGEFGKKRSLIKAKPKATKEELPYLSWLHEDAQMKKYCCIVCDAPVQDWHHVKLYSMDTKDHKRLIPLCKKHHTGGSPSPHITPVLWRNTYSMDFQNTIADKIYGEYVRIVSI